MPGPAPQRLSLPTPPVRAAARSRSFYVGKITFRPPHFTYSTIAFYKWKVLNVKNAQAAR